MLLTDGPVLTVRLIKDSEWTTQISSRRGTVGARERPNCLTEIRLLETVRLRLQAWLTCSFG